MQDVSVLGKVGGGRLSNLELLRLLSMLMILNLHSFWGYNHGTGILQALDFFRESLAICAVNVFLIISGYFGIKWKIKSFFNLIFQLFFYAFSVYFVSVFLGVIDFSLSGLLNNLKCLYAYWGFITWYLLLYICSPLLNSFVEKVKNKKLLGYIIILLLSEHLLTRDYAFLNYCTMYLIGRYIFASGAVNNSRIKPGLFYWLTSCLIFVLVYLTYKFLHVESALRMATIPWGFDYAAPLVVLQAVFLFIWFARLEIQSKLINWLATSCLSVFLIHMHPTIKQNGYYSYTESLYSLPAFEHIWKLFLLMTIIFFGSILIDKIRIFVSSVFYSLFLWIISITKVSQINIMSYIPNQVGNE